MLKFAEVHNSHIQGKGLFPTRDITPGEVVWYPSPGDHKTINRSLLGKMPQELYDEFRIYGYSVNDNEFSIMQDDSKYFNHSCEPNLIWSGYRLIAKYFIPFEEELTFDYGSTETEPSYSFQCSCGSKSCRKSVTGLDWQKMPLHELSPYVYKKYLETLANHPFEPENPEVCECCHIVWKSIDANGNLMGERCVLPRYMHPSFEV